MVVAPAAEGRNGASVCVFGSAWSADADQSTFCGRREWHQFRPYSTVLGIGLMGGRIFVCAKNESQSSGKKLLRPTLYRKFMHRVLWLLRMRLNVLFKLERQFVRRKNEECFTLKDIREGHIAVWPCDSISKVKRTFLLAFNESENFVY